jgi:hypothetical protein
MLYQKFSHRHNEDDTHDSICMACFATIATVGSETELYQHESAHVCDPVHLCQINQGYAPQPFIRGQGSDLFKAPNVLS